MALKKVTLFALIRACSDLYSFYKEEKAGEKDNLISQLAAINRQTPLQAARDLADKAFQLDLQIKEILGDTPERKTWESFTAGYAEYHMQTPRYRLKEILSECYNEV